MTQTPMTPNNYQNTPLDLLLSRRSVKAKDMIGPAPDKKTLETILTAATRVPDHGKLSPWRYIVLMGDARQKLGDAIAHGLKVEQEASPKIIEKMQDYGTQAPVCIIAVYSPSNRRPIPEWEQQLSMGASIMNLITATHAAGFVAQWLTGWAAFSPTVASELGLSAQEKIAGFIFLGSQATTPSERPRPKLDEIVQWHL